MKPKRQPKPAHDVLQLCAIAAERLKAAGFQVAYVSSRSEAVYFRFPGREGLLRVSAHRSKHPPMGLPDPVAKLTFTPDNKPAQTLRCSYMKLDSLIWYAIGAYMEASMRPLKSKYQGKRGTWEIGRIVPQAEA